MNRIYRITSKSIDVFIDVAAVFSAVLILSFIVTKITTGTASFFGYRPLHGYYIPSEQSETIVFSEFKALVKQQLHPETDTEKRFPGSCLLEHDAVKTGFPQLIDGISECSDPRQNNTIRFPNLLRICRDAGFQIQALQRAAEGEQIPHPVVDYCDHPRTPLVLGIRSGFFPSTAAAAPSARAKALKKPSTMWWELLPES